jgi:hypothetical protein
VQAGSTIQCICGASVDVPLLSALRRSAGETAMPLNSIETIQALIRDGELPSGDVCPYSGAAADRTFLVRVQCERSFVRGSDPIDAKGAIFYVVFLGWIGALIAYCKSSGRREELGRDTIIDLPLRVSADAAAKLARLRGQRTWKALLRKSPAYARLLDEYPEARITPITSGAS